MLNFVTLIPPGPTAVGLWGYPVQHLSASRMQWSQLLLEHSDEDLTLHWREELAPVDSEGSLFNMSHLRLLKVTYVSS